MSTTALYSTRVYYEEKLQEATVVIKNGKIDFVVKGRYKSQEAVFENYNDAVIMPGVIDAHVHINDPGREDWEGFETATKAAAYGGVTTLVDMPLNSSPVTVDKEKLELKLKASKNRLHVNCGFYAGVIPNNVEGLQEILEEGVLGVKAFLSHSGIDEFPNVTEEDLREALPLLKKHNATLLVHCEIESEHANSDLIKDAPKSYDAYLKSRPTDWEDKAIKMLIRLCDEYQVRMHVVHLSAATSIEQLEMAQQLGVPITVETCPQYICLNAEDIPDGDTRFKCAPPIRDRKNNEQLWGAIESGLIDFITTDHSPATPNLKELDSGNLLKAWGGISSLGLALQLVWHHANTRGMSLLELIPLFTKNPAKFLNLDDRKGEIKEGYDADICIWSPQTGYEVNEAMLHFKHKVSPYLGAKIKGKVIKTYVNGQQAYPFTDAYAGEVILKN